MTAKRDYSCEVIAFVVLTILSALSHFWYILIALVAIVLLAEMALVISRMILRIRMEMLSRMFSTDSPANAMAATQGSGGTATPSSPLA